MKKNIKIHSVQTLSEKLNVKSQAEAQKKSNVVQVGRGLTAV